MDFALKRTFDFIAAAIGLVLVSPIILVAWIIASVEVRGNGFFVQRRVGQHGKIFKLVKIKSMKPVKGVDTTVTSSGDPRVTRSGLFFRKTKIDELPQLWNVFWGQMSLVGPRPDVEGFADVLQGDDRVVLSVKPGITGPASIAFKNEEALLAAQSDPEKYNREVIFPKKVEINKVYIDTWSFLGDLKYIIRTIL